MTDLAIIADDLSGAAESAAACLLRTTRIDVRLSTDMPMTRVTDKTAARVLVIDTDSRQLTSEAAAARVRDAVESTLDARLVVKKVDSLLRGNLAPEIAALLAHSSEVVVATALPALGRTVVDGIPLIHGVPLVDTTLWEAENSAAPADLAAALAPIAIEVIPADVLDQGAAALAELLADAVAAGRLPVCDCRTDDDLDLILDAAALIWTRPIVVGTAAMAAAAARRLSLDTSTAVLPEPAGLQHLSTWHSAAMAGSSVLVVIGSAASVIAAQHAVLTPLVTSSITLAPTAVLDPAQRQQLENHVLAAVLAGGVTAVVIDPNADVDPTLSRELAAGITSIVAPAAAHARALVLTGGETARTVLDRIGLDQLTPLHQIHHGAVISGATTGQLIATRPGSFGDSDSLAAIVRALLSAVSSTQGESMTAPATTTNLPFIAVTMGDGAGVGPEVVVRALLDPQITSILRAVVVGDTQRLRQAADLLGIEVDLVTVATVADAEFVPGRINVIDLNLLPADLPFGVLSPVAGDAAFHYIRVASELAMSGQVQAICTAPLNKEALHAGGHLFPGHTELLASLTGTKEVSMMLSTPKVNVIHVTTHIGLVDAIKKIEPGLVERTIRRGHKAMVDSGIANPKIGVCAINPHAGENGLFGQGEEESKINPAVRICQADGIDVTGALPADTLFFLAGRGDYDLVVAMYHDQGHGPVKVLGLESGVNITVGLPVIRTSVDHGTAFDIAGKGIADPGSMVEALRQAAEMAPTPDH